LIVNEADLLFVFFTDRQEAYERQDREGRKSGSVDDVELANAKGIPVYEYDAKTQMWYHGGRGDTALQYAPVIEMLRERLDKRNRAIQLDAHERKGDDVIYDRRGELAADPPEWVNASP
jgi:hypothetical protein